MPLDYDKARTLIETALKAAEERFLTQQQSRSGIPLSDTLDTVFQSNTQAYREVLLGCLVARVQDRSVDITSPYVNLGENAFSGRTLDERVVNPVLSANRIPATRGPYLSVFRRSVRFNESIRGGLRDQAGFDAFLEVLSKIHTTNDNSELHALLDELLIRFIEAREQQNVPILRVPRISVAQYAFAVKSLLNTPSGGRFPMLLVETALKTVSSTLNLGWNVVSQGINVADTASGASGDITAYLDDQPILTAEVTERPVDRSRVLATFNNKIAPAGLEDYIFFVRIDRVEQDALEQVRRYFAQGTDVTFVDIESWITAMLVTLGPKGRGNFNSELISLLEQSDAPRAMRQRWNEVIEQITSSTSE